ncbi:hypothetical protein [Streptomyces jumonjinensis]|uniref:hypothetical protein n=1 Tax=Streptomyces jumonjinensis TaxID=1945 RepID=UPI001E4FDA1F|nr:hypothetical protein [Streptomyces jumonjinensis]
MATLPDTVSRAIRSELEAEKHGLQTGLADFSGTSSEEEPETERCWEFGHPFVKYDDGLDTLNDETREQLDRHESGFTSEEREKAVAALRVLVTAHSQSGDAWASLDDPSCRLFMEPYDSDGFYLTIEAPEPGDDEASWEIEVGRWVPHDPEEEPGNHTSATGHAVVGCALPVAPAAEEIAHLLKSVDEKLLLLAEWAAAPAGAVLAGTAMVVTERYDS